MTIEYLLTCVYVYRESLSLRCLRGRVCHPNNNGFVYIKLTWFYVRLYNCSIFFTNYVHLSTHMVGSCMKVRSSCPWRYLTHVPSRIWK